MPQAIDVTVNPQSQVKCSNCGSTYTFSSTMNNFTIEVCGNCHPFYTGQDSVLDTTGRIERFQARFQKSQDLQSQAAAAGAKKQKTRRVRQTLADLDTNDNPAEVKEENNSAE